MRRHYFYAAAIAVITAIITSACSLDPWATGQEYPNIVTITKITSYGKAADGVSPMKSSLGVVKFSHKTHEDMGLKCDTCHHKNSNPGREKKCAVCHIGDKGYNTMHGLCLDCHIGKKDGPQQCAACH